MTSQAEQIAAGLTEAQRKAINSECGVPRTSEEWTSDCICKAGEVWHELRSLDLAVARHYFPQGIVLTPLGQQVRAILTAQGEIK